MHLTDLLLKNNQEVVIYDTVTPDEIYLKNPRVKFIKGDIRDFDLLATAMSGSDIVQHNAAILPLNKPGPELFEVNVSGTEKVLRAAEKNGIKKVICISSSSVFGIQTGEVISDDAEVSPIDDYGSSKAKSEEVCKGYRSEHDLDVSIVRPCPIIGAGRMGIFGILFDWIAAGKRVYTIGKGDNPYQFVGVDDLADLCFQLSAKPSKNQDFNAGSAGYGTSAEDLEKLIAHAGTMAKLFRIPAGPARLILRILDALHISPLVRYHYMTADKPHRVSIEKAKRLLGWQPKETNIDVLIRTYDWYMKNRDQLNKLEGSPHRKPLKQGILKILRFFS